MSGTGHYRAGAVLIVIGGLAAAAFLLLIALSSVRLGEHQERQPGPPKAQPKPAPRVAQSATPTVPAEVGPVPRPLTLEEAVMHPTHHLGQPVRVSGQVAAPPGMPAGQIVLYRLTEACCETDANPIALVVHLPPDAPAPAVGTWQEATGTLQLVEGGPVPGPALLATRLYHLPAPADPHPDHP